MIMKNSFYYFSFHIQKKINCGDTMQKEFQKLATEFNKIKEKGYIKERLCRTKIKDIELWRDENLMENLVAKRIKTLKTA